MVSQRIVTFDRSRFPEGDGDPMPEMESHQEQSTGLKHGARTLLAGRPDAYVGGNHFLYYDVDEPKHNVAPDVYVAFGVEQRDREYYLSFEEGVFPQLVIEVISRSSRKDDNGGKVALYAEQGVLEYYVCDPRPDVQPRTRIYAYRLASGTLVRQVIGSDRRVHSELLDTDLQLIGRFLRIIDPGTGMPIPTPTEETALRRALERQLAEEASARRALERQLAEEASGRRALERQWAEEASARRAIERQWAEEMTLRRGLEHRLATLEALMERLSLYEVDE